MYGENAPRSKVRVVERTAYSETYYYVEKRVFWLFWVFVEHFAEKELAVKFAIDLHKMLNDGPKECIVWEL